MAQIQNTKTKWRGIPTTTKRKNEKKAVTIINRLGQKSISLPRITDDKRFAGYNGLAGTGKKFAKFIVKNCSDFEVFVEPFSGSAKVCQELMKLDNNFKQFILNDNSKFVIEWLQREMSQATITESDFVDCIKKYDSEKTVFMIDAPWDKPRYKQKFLNFNRDSIKEYDEQITSLCSGKPYGKFNLEGYKIKGKFIIASRKENRVFLKSGFKHKLVKSIYVLSGHYPKVLLTTNIGMK